MWSVTYAIEKDPAGAGSVRCWGSARVGCEPYGQYCVLPVWDAHPPVTQEVSPLHQVGGGAGGGALLPYVRQHDVYLSNGHNETGSAREGEGGDGTADELKHGPKAAEDRFASMPSLYLTDHPLYALHALLVWSVTLSKRKEGPKPPPDYQITT